MSQTLFYNLHQRFEHPAKEGRKYWYLQRRFSVAIPNLIEVTVKQA